MSRLQRSFRNALRHLVVLAGGLMLVAAPSVAFAADDDDPFDRPGPYIGLGGVYQSNPFAGKIEDLIEDEVGDPSNFDLGDSGGLTALVGYRLASFFAAELQYEWIDDYTIKGSASGFSGDIYTINGHTLTANGKLLIPFWRIQPYLVLGVGFSSWHVDRGSLVNPANFFLGTDLDVHNGTQTDFAGRAGLGVDLYITENIVLNAQGQAVITTLKEPDLGDIDDLNYVGLSAGLQYRF